MQTEEYFGLRSTGYARTREWNRLKNECKQEMAQVIELIPVSRHFYVSIPLKKMSTLIHGLLQAGDYKQYLQSYGGDYSKYMQGQGSQARSSQMEVESREYTLCITVDLQRWQVA